MAWPDDPDKRRVAKGSTDTKALKKFCDDPMLGRPEAERAKRDAECADKQGGLLSKASSLLPGFGNKKEGAAAETSDEGDPGVVTGSTKAQAASAQKPIGSAKTR